MQGLHSRWVQRRENNLKPARYASGSRDELQLGLLWYCVDPNDE